jgi:hypothetical protein
MPSSSRADEWNERSGPTSAETLPVAGRLFRLRALGSDLAVALSARLAGGITSIALCFTLCFQGDGAGGDLSRRVSLLSLTGGAFGGFHSMLSDLAGCFRCTRSLACGDPIIPGVADRLTGCLSFPDRRIIRTRSGAEPLKGGLLRGGCRIEAVSEISARMRARRRG